MPNSLCRLSVRRGDHEVDLALPGQLTVGELMPSIIDITSTDHDAAARLWRLSKIGGPALDEWMSLEDNDVRDGDVLLLSAEEPQAPQWFALDASHVVVRGPADAGVVHAVSAVGAIGMGATGAGVLVWSTKPLAAAGLALAAVAAVVSGRGRTDPLLCTTLSLLAVVFTAAAGWLAVPTGPPAARALLAASAALTVAVILMRLMRSGAVVLTAAATAALIAGAVAAAALWLRLGPEAAGAMTSVLSIASLTVAPRISIAVTGVGPAMPSIDDTPDLPADSVAERAHHLLTGAVIGTSVCAPVGAALAANAALAAVVALVLVLRSRTYADSVRKVALWIGGLLSAAACFVVVTATLPAYGEWAGIIAAAVGAAAVSPMLKVNLTLMSRRAIDILDYVALAALVPVACWVGAVFELVRGMTLP